MATNPGTVTPFAGGVDGRLLLDLQTAGVNKEDIDTVFLTHLHPITWVGTLTMTGLLRFPLSQMPGSFFIKTIGKRFAHREIARYLDLLSGKRLLRPWRALGL